MGFAKTEQEWQARASAFLKAKMKETGITYIDLVKRLKKHGFAETEASVTMKLKRGTFAATWFLACLAALELDGVRLEDI
jgi:virulence-associated protein VapD